MTWPLYAKQELRLHAEIPSVALISIQHQIVYMLNPQSHSNSNPKGLLPVSQPKRSHHETVNLWNSLWQGAVPTAIPWIASLLPQAFNPPRIVGATWKLDGLTKESQWWVSLNVHKKLSLVWVLKFKNELKINVNQTEISSDLNSAKMHFWSKFWNPNFPKNGGELWHGQPLNGVNFDF